MRRRVSGDGAGRAAPGEEATSLPDARPRRPDVDSGGRSEATGRSYSRRLARGATGRWWSDPLHGRPDLPSICTKCSTLVLCKYPPSTVAPANCRWCLLRDFIPSNHPCSLIASSHQMPGCEIMIPSLESPRSPLVDPPPLRIPPLKWRWRLVDWIPDTLHR